MSDFEDDLPIEKYDDRGNYIDDYESGNDNDSTAEEKVDDNILAIKHNKNNGGFDYCMDAKGNINLKVSHTFYTVYNFTKILKVFAVKHGFRLKMIKN